MVQYTYIKQINTQRLLTEIKAAGLSQVDRIDTFGLSVLIYFQNPLSAPQKITLDSVVASHVLKTAEEIVYKIVGDAIIFSNELVKEFAVQNVLLGITQLGLTGHVRRTLREVKDALDTGSIYDVITEIKNLNPEDFDDVILTPVRLLAFRNKIETYLQVPLAANWNDAETWL